MTRTSRGGNAAGTQGEGGEDGAWDDLGALPAWRHAVQQLVDLSKAHSLENGVTQARVRLDATRIRDLVAELASVTADDESTKVFLGELERLISAKRVTSAGSRLYTAGAAAASSGSSASRVASGTRLNAGSPGTPGSGGGSRLFAGSPGASGSGGGSRRYGGGLVAGSSCSVPVATAASPAQAESPESPQASDDESPADGNAVSVNQYDIQSVLGFGSFGVVVRAVDRDSGLEYAIKVIDPHRVQRASLGMPGQVVSLRAAQSRREEADLDPLRREVAIHKRLAHPYILPLYEVIVGPGAFPRTYVVLKLVSGGPVMADASKQAALPELRCRRIFVQLVSALRYLHATGIVHLDIKPSNLLVEQGSERLYLSDFGVSRAFRPDELAVIEATQGTMGFFSPEMCTGGGPFDGKLADVWAAGATLFMMATGSPPFISASAAVLADKIANCDVSWAAARATVPADLIDLLTKLLAPKERRLSLLAIADHAALRGETVLRDLPGFDDAAALVVAAERAAATASGSAPAATPPSRDEMARALSPWRPKSMKDVGEHMLSARRSVLKLKRKRSTVPGSAEASAQHLANKDGAQ